MRARLTLAALCALLFFPSLSAADIIHAFVSTVHIQKDGSAEVTEDITYDFGTQQHHGIYRDIPTVYKDDAGELRRIEIDGIAVTDGKLAPYEFKVEPSGDIVRLKIGNPATLVTGVQTYKISYTAHDVIGFFDDHDELYWNATGNEWPLQIDASGARIYAPASTTAQSCYLGFRGSTDKCGSVLSIAADGSAFFFVAGRALAPGEGLTVAVGFPRGYVTRPPVLYTLWKNVKRFLVFLVPAAAFIFLFIRWWRHGRDAKGRGTIIPEYDVPAGMTPAMISELMHESVSTASVSATIVALAVRGYLKITREESKTLGIFESVSYRFDRLKVADAGLSTDELVIYEALFKSRDTVTSEELKTDRALVSARSTVQKSVGGRMVTDGYYRANPTTTKSVYAGAGIAIAVVGFFLANAAQSAFTAVAFIITGVLVALFGLIMPARTQKGALLREQILGLKDYLQIAEKNRLDFHNAPEKSPEIFEKLLPAAIVLGVSAAWAKEFEGIYKDPPTWYAGASYAAFSPVNFESDMRSMTTAVAAVATPTSGSGGSGGGGFSGGGFGGGGGGSW